MSDVRDFGAIGDGVADDADAIQHAIEQGDGRIVFPPGTYRLTRAVEVPLDRDGPKALSGSGGVARVVMAGPGPAFRLVGTHGGSALPSSVKPGVWDRERMPTVSALEIIGEHDRAVGLALEGTLMATITDVLIRRCLYGVHLVKRNRNVLISHCHLYDGRPLGIGVYFDGVNLHQSNIVGSHISYWPHAGVKVRGGEVRNLQITGCDIEYNFDPAAPDCADVWIDSREGTVREVTIASNTIQAKESPGGANVRVEGPERPDSAGAGLLTIAGNILQSQAVNLLLKHCRGVAVTGNSFASGFARSLEIDACRAIAVGSNTFDHNPDYPGAIVDGIRIRRSAGINLSGLLLDGIRAGGLERGGAIEVADSSEISIVGCQVLDPMFRGLDLDDVRNTRVADCAILDRRNPPEMVEPIRWTGTEAGNALANTLVGAGTTGPLDPGRVAARVAEVTGAKR